MTGKLNPSSITRRNFIYQASLAGILGLSATAFKEQEAIAATIFKNKKVNVDAHPWVYAAPLPKFDITPVLEQIFGDVKYAGINGVELMHQPLRNSETTEKIGELSAKYKLPVIGTSYEANMWDKTKHEEIRQDVELIVKNLLKVGGRTLGTSVGHTDEAKTEEQLNSQAELLKQLIKICNGNGIVLNLHNHTYEVENNMHDLNGTLQRIPDAKLGPDLNWLIRGGVDPVQFITTYKNQLVFLHLRDQYKNGKWSESLGEGDTDFKAIAEALKAIDFKGDAIIELAHEGGFKPTRPIRESLKMSREYVRKTMGF